jgi:small subunit ribosomal protein S6
MHISILPYSYHSVWVLYPKGGEEVMNKYETLFIINPNVEEAGVKDIVDKFSDIINSDGKVESSEVKGKKKLAYEVKKNEEGIYALINFEANPSLIKELERVFRITDDVIKFIVVRKDEK